MYFPNEIWRNIKNYSIGFEYWKRIFSFNFDFIKAYRCDKEYLKFKNRIIYQGLSHSSNKLEKCKFRNRNTYHILCYNKTGVRYESIHYIN